METYQVVVMIMIMVIMMMILYREKVFSTGTEV